MNCKNKKTVFILVCGGSGSGKSTIANELIKKLPKNLTSTVIRQDNFYKSNPELSFEERSKVNYDHPDAFDWKIMQNVISKILLKETVSIPIYDYSNHLAKEGKNKMGAHDVVIFEGIYALFNSDINKLADLKIYVDTPSDERLIRRLQRDMVERNRTAESIIRQWKTTVRPMYKNFVENQKLKADLIIPWYKLNNLALIAVKNAILGFNN